MQAILPFYLVSLFFITMIVFFTFSENIEKALKIDLLFWFICHVFWIVFYLLFCIYDYKIATCIYLSGMFLDLVYQAIRALIITLESEV